jgi:uncharacterized protein YkwD
LEFIVWIAIFWGLDCHGRCRRAENIGAGTFTDTPTKLVAQLMRSSGHCANIMNPKFTEVGMAMVKKSSSKYTYYWTQNFGTPPN